MGVDNGFPSGDIDLFISASESGVGGIYDNIPLNIRGQGVETSGTDLYITSYYPTAGLPLFMGNPYPDSVVTVNQHTLTIDGIYSSDTEKAANLYIYGTTTYGDVDPQSFLPLYIQGPGTDDSIDPTSAMNLFMEGKFFNDNSNVTLSILNSTSGVNDSTDLFIQGPAGTPGASPSNGSMPLYIERTPAHDGMVNLFMLGHENPISSGVNMFITGTLPTETLDTNLFMANYTSNNNLEIYMRGFK